ncbi:MAG: hypothetical protein FWH03_00165 [Firmicutes bacterium]|nr:hypothetical protein [Bacillota bacterium]
MSEQDKKFSASEFTARSINGEKEFKSSDALFCDDVNKIINGILHLYNQEIPDKIGEHDGKEDAHENAISAAIADHILNDEHVLSGSGVSGKYSLAVEYVSFPLSHTQRSFSVAFSKPYTALFTQVYYRPYYQFFANGAGSCPGPGHGGSGCGQLVSDAGTSGCVGACRIVNTQAQLYTGPYNITHNQDYKTFHIKFTGTMPTEYTVASVLIFGLQPKN